MRENLNKKKMRLKLVKRMEIYVPIFSQILWFFLDKLQIESSYTNNRNNLDSHRKSMIKIETRRLKIAHIFA